MEFRLTYQGILLGANSKETRAKHKHEIRRQFHVQLKRYWGIHPHLKDAVLVSEFGVPLRPEKKLLDSLAERFSRNGYSFVPLVTADLEMVCSISILFLRPDLPGTIVKSGDIDNRLKTIFDALRMPTDKNELGGYDAPGEGETPFYCLLEDDALITHITLETDTMLQPTSESSNDNDARLMIAIKLRPHAVSWQNINFG